jgi:superfamily II RNA helicase
MVKICDINNYPSENEEKYKEHFTKFPYELSIFQKHAIEGIIEGNHVLITAHTGSGKTLAGEFAIEHFVSQGKKVIYTGPTKSLINQKFYEFQKKYKHISFGIITGDVKSNPEADVLVVTAEILLNKLYQLKGGKTEILLNKEKSGGTLIKNPSNSFDMDIENELACVIMDEVHYLNDKDRGFVWETTMMMLPKQVQMVMLSATIDKPEQFAKWCESIHPYSDKQVYLTNTTHRVVPLTHYSFITATQSVFKTIKDKATQEEIRRSIDKPFVIQDANGGFNDINYRTIANTLKLFDDNDIRIKRQHVLNKITEHLVEKELLPALCFVLSRKQLEICAHEVTTNLLEFDSKVPYIIDRECEQIIRKLPNYKEYLNLPEYLNMVSLLRKGIAIHHSGVTPIFKEMVELLYSKGYIKLLFATETFSVGVNMPTKSVIFTDVSKFDGNTSRILFAHEYVQMAGRAGRRGLDTLGYVFHLNNLFRDTNVVTYKTMMNGKPQTLKSKFKISYNLLLNLIDIGETDYSCFAKRSMMQGDIEGQSRGLNSEIDKCKQELNRLNLCIDIMRTPRDIVEKYQDLQQNKDKYANKKRKEMEKEIQKIKDNNKYVDQDVMTIQKFCEKVEELTRLKNQYEGLSNSIKNDVENVLYWLREESFLVTLTKQTKVSEVSVDATVFDDKIESTITDTTVVSETTVEEECLTLKGKIASCLREVHCLIFADLLLTKRLQQFDVFELIALFSCFTNVSVPDYLMEYTLNSEENNIKKFIKEVAKMYEDKKELEIQEHIDTGIDYNIHYDLIDYVVEWANCSNEADCRLLLDRIGTEKEIFLGEFVKALLKINNIASEMERVAELMGDVEFLHKLKQIPELTLKFVATNQSLYV